MLIRAIVIFAAFFSFGPVLAQSCGDYPLTPEQSDALEKARLEETAGYLAEELGHLAEAFGKHEDDIMQLEQKLGGLVLKGNVSELHWKSARVQKLGDLVVNGDEVVIIDI